MQSKNFHSMMSDRYSTPPPPYTEVQEFVEEGPGYRRVRRIELPNYQTSSQYRDRLESQYLRPSSKPSEHLHSSKSSRTHVYDSLFRSERPPSAYSSMSQRRHDNHDRSQTWRPEHQNFRSVRHRSHRYPEPRMPIFYNQSAREQRIAESERVEDVAPRQRWRKSLTEITREAPATSPTSDNARTIGLLQYDQDDNIPQGYSKALGGLSYNQERDDYIPGEDSSSGRSERLSFRQLPLEDD